MIFCKWEPILMQIGTSGRWGKGMKCSSLGVRMSKLKVTRPDRSQMSRELSSMFDQTWQGRITVNNPLCHRLQKVKGQGDTRPQLDVEAWRRCHSRATPWSRVAYLLLSLKLGAAVTQRLSRARVELLPRPTCVIMDSLTTHSRGYKNKTVLF